MTALAGCVPVAAIEGTPEPVLVLVDVPVIAVAPASGPPGEVVSVAGAGWDENEVITLVLQKGVDGAEDAAEELTLTVTTADAEGRFTSTFVYPLEGIWAQTGDEVQILARSPRRAQPASAMFAVLATADATATAAVQPTATPTTVPTTAPTATNTPAAAATHQPNLATVTSSALNLRSGPSSAYAILRTLHRGDRLTVLGQSANAYWLYVRATDGLEGWVARPYTDYRDQAPTVDYIPPTAGPVNTPTPLPTPTSRPAATSAPQNNWRADYYVGADLWGTPVLSRSDAAVYFDWGYGSPAWQVPIDRFSARWVRSVYFDGGLYRFAADTDDGVRVFVDDQPVINEWHLASGSTYYADRHIDQGVHTVRIEFFENTGTAKINVWWERRDDASYPDWRGEYYNNASLAGSPVIVRNDSAVDFDWGYDAPAAGVGSDNFSVRWSRTIFFEEGRYRFTGRFDDGMRVYVDGQTLIDDWQDNSVRNRSGEIYLSRGHHAVAVDYYERAGVAEAHLSWERIDETPASFPDWKGEYWTNRSLDGDPRVVRNDRHVDFRWGTGSPDSRLPGDNFSARWTRTIDFDAGWYRFYARSDDGVRVWVGGDRIIDAWDDQRGNETHTADIYLDGDERVKVEYYEHVGGALVDVWFDRIDAPEPTATSTPTATPTLTPTMTPTLTPTPAEPRQPYAQVRPARGGPGDEVTVRGGGFPANATITLYLGAPVQADALERSAANRYATTRSNGDGDFAVVFPLPSAWPDGTLIESGQLLILAATDNFVVTASALLDYAADEPPPATAPSIRLEPQQGGPGDAVTVSGGGFPGGATVNIHLAALVEAQRMQAGPAVYASAVVRADGTFDVTFTLPAAWPDGSALSSGKLAVVAATADFGVEAAAAFDFFIAQPDPSLQAQPLFGGPNTQVIVSGDGFPANAELVVLLATLDEQVGAGSNPQVYASSVTDQNGGYSMTFALPGFWPDGSVIDNEEIVIIVTTVDYALQASVVFDYIPADVAPVEPDPTSPPPAADTPTAGVSPATGAPGSQVTVSGGGFPANVNLTVYLARYDASGAGGQRERYATTTSNGDGAYSVSFALPSQWPDGASVENGPILILAATDDFLHEAGATFEISGVTADRESPAGTIPGR